MRRHGKGAQGPRAVALWLALAGSLGSGAGCRRAVTFDQADIDRHPMLAGAPPGFLLGVATSAHQIEGGHRNDWTEWEKGSYPDGTPHVKGGATTERAADSWNLWPKDVAAAATLGANVYRLGVEWSRLEPAEGQWDAGAAERYREMLQALRAVRPHPIEPMLNLWHFTLPPWIVARGGWEWDGAPAAFAAFASRAAAAFGDLVDWWCPLNEPNVYVTKSYMAGQWPPGVKDPKRAARALGNLLRAHARAAAALRASDRADADGDGRATRIGLAHNVIVFDPASGGPLDRLIARYSDRFYNHDIPDSIAAGRIKLSLPTVVSVDEAEPELAGSLDWLGLNYYTRRVVASRLFGDRGPTGAPYEVVEDPARPHNDLGWEIYPEGLYRMLVRFREYPWPLIVTESGVADRAGTVRPGFIRAHVYALDRARAEGVNVIGYMHWSLIDNFEWSHGYEGRFGLFTIDFAGDPTLERRPTPAVATFQDLARNLGLLPSR